MMNKIPRYTPSQVHKASERSRIAYARWAREMTLLSMGSLTLLVSLQTHYAPPGSRLHWMLVACWVSLGISTVCGAVIQWGVHETHLEMARKIQEKLKDQFSHGPIAVLPPIASRVASHVLPWSLASSMVFLCCFAIVNIPSEKKPGDPVNAKRVQDKPAA